MNTLGTLMTEQMQVLQLEYMPFFFFNPFLNKPWFLRVCITSLLKALQEKEKLLVTSNISFSCSAFYLCRELSATFNKFDIVVCKHFVWKSLKFVGWERVKDRLGSGSMMKILSSTSNVLFL